jgi:HK97 family phage portal protein
VSYVLGRPEKRQLQFISPPIPPNSQAGYGGGSVDLTGVESSLQKIAVWACVNLTATIAETMPVDTFIGTEKDRRPAEMPTWMEDLDGSGHGLGDWLYQFVFSAMLRGNDYGMVADRDRTTGNPTQIVLQHPDEVRVRRSSDGKPVWTVCGKQVPLDRIWHRRFYPVPGQIEGMSPIEQHAMTIGLGLMSLRFGRQWFQDGAHPSAILSNEESDMADEKVVRTAKQRFLAAVRGTREPVVLGKGWKYQAIQINPNESQFLETNNYTSAECCRIFGPAYAEIFGYATGGSMTYANIEQRSLDVLTYAVDPWLVRIENVLTKLLPGGMYAKFNRKALVRTDLLTRYRAHEIALRNRFTVVNEVRDVEDMSPVTWGDEPNQPSTGPTPVTIEGQ